MCKSKDTTKGCHLYKLHMSATTHATEFIKHMEGNHLHVDQALDIQSQ